MRKFRIVVAGIVSAAIFGIGGLTFSSVINAQNDTSVRGSGLQISPTRAELVADPGKEQIVELDLKNVSGAPVVAKPFINDFTADDRSGAPKIVTNTDKSSPFSIARFIKGLQDVPLENNQTKKIRLTLSVPAGTSPGAYYGVIRYQAVPLGQLDQPQQISLTASVGEIVLIEVPGKITEGMVVNSVTFTGGKKLAGIFYEKPTKAEISLKNTGNSFLKPFGAVTVSKNGKEAYRYELNDTDPKGNVLPQSSRIFTNDIKNIGSLGKFDTSANIGYGKSGSLISASKTFWVIPLWLLVGLPVALIVLIIGGALMIQKKTRNSRVKR